MNQTRAAKPVESPRPQDASGSTPKTITSTAAGPAPHEPAVHDPQSPWLSPSIHWTDGVDQWGLND